MDHPAHRAHVAVQVAWGLADDHVQLGPLAGIGRIVAPGTDHAVAVRHPGGCRLVVAGGGKTVDEAGRIAPAIRVGQGSEGHAARGHLELGRQGGSGRTQRAGDGRVIGQCIAKLGHEIVLYPVHAQSVPEALPGQLADVGHMPRGKLRRQLDHHQAAGQLHIEQVVRVGRAPGTGRGGGDDLCRRHRRRGVAVRFGGLGRCSRQGQGKQGGGQQQAR